jgi:hypothetical protein
MRLAVMLLALPVFSQVPAAPGTPRAVAPINMSGYWVSIVSEDWRIRMLTAPKGDYYSIPLTDEARRLADNWDAARDVAQSRQCLSYGAAGIMRVPGRLHFTWDNDTTLRLETDAGRQMRTFYFGARPAATRASPQGISMAQWQTPQSTREYTSKISAQDPNTPGFPGNTPTGERPRDERNLGGSLRAVTNNMTPGYLRNNGVPYGAGATMTEFYSIHKTGGVDYLVQTQIVEDPQYLLVPWVTTQNFKREADASKWDPRGCELILPNVK